MTGNKYEFKAEIKKLLDILSKSLYQHKEVFLRELVSNSVDALKKIHFISLTEKDLQSPDEELKIEIIINPEDKTLLVRDTGVGMTKDELINNLGIIAGSGSQKFLEQLNASQQSELEKLDLDIIGQFGIGFYSIFMVADKVEVTSKSHVKEEPANMWASEGTGDFTIEPSEKVVRGTEVKLYLKEDESEYLDQFRIESIVKKYSNYVSFPIYVLKIEPEVEKKEEKEDKGEEKAEKEEEKEPKPVNELAPLWKRSPKDVTDEDYKGFYHFISNRYDDYIHVINYKVDGKVQFRSILYVPEASSLSFIRPEDEYGLTLYSKNVMIMKNCQDVIPKWLRFVTGIVDSDDIPLNISRDTIQVNRVMMKIEKLLVKKVLREFDNIIEKDPEKYKKIWHTYGFYLKEGVVTDPVKSETLLKYLRFRTSKTEDGDYKSLDQYVDALQEDQEEIFYLVGENMDTLKLSPHLGYYNEKNIEVLLFDEPIDNFLMMNVRDYKKTVAEGDEEKTILYKFTPIDVTEPSKDEKAAQDAKEGEEKKEESDAKLPEPLKKFLEKVKSILGEKIVDAKASNRLYNNVCRLANPSGGMTSSMQRAMRYWTATQAGKDFQIPQKIFEFNPEHPIVKGLIALHDKEPENENIKVVVEQLFENCLLSEGDLPNPSLMVPRITQIIEMLMQAIQEKKKT
ncbi:MAG: molecular chaperone HtpG [Candidatus Lokiarchaeota archaeon]|nr:molecular chaperone HtpG [Candidatus Lokiarchaeota archaeon]